MNIIYVSHIPQSSNMNWVSLTAKTLSSHSEVSRVIHIDFFKKSIEFKDLFLSKNLFNLFKQISEIICKKYVDLTFYNIVPFQRFKSVLEFNTILNLLGLGLLFAVTGKPTVLITTYSNHDWLSRILSYIKIRIVIADCTDIWPVENIKYMAQISDVFCVNSESMLKHVSKYIKSPKLIATGYFPKMLMENIAKKTTNATRIQKNLVLISSVNWRVNFAFINKILDELTDYTFYLIGPDMFGYFKEANWGYKNTKALREWKILRNRGNFKHIIIHDQEDLQNITIKHAVGLITYDLKDRFNTFCHPIKLYQYYAMGFPVVSVSVPSILNQKSETFLKFADTVSDFSQGVKLMNSKKLSKADRRKMLAISVSQSFESKSDELVQIIKEKL